MNNTGNQPINFLRDQHGRLTLPPDNTPTGDWVSLRRQEFMELMNEVKRLRKRTEYNPYPSSIMGSI